MHARRGVMMSLGAGLLLLAGGCKSLSCANPAAYSSAQEVPPLKMPVGLDGPDTKEALKIPALNEPEVPRELTGQCLEDPPVLDRSSIPAGTVVPNTPEPEPERRRQRVRGVTPRG